MMTVTRLGCLTLVAAITPSTALAQFKVDPDKQNVVASRLAGKWTPDDKLTNRLGGKAIGVLRFKRDNKVAGQLPAKFGKFLKDKQIFMAGHFVVAGKHYPFILITHSGNPHVVAFRSRNGDPFGDAESFNVAIAVAQDRQNDLLLIGGDFNNQPFAAYRRHSD